MRPHQEQPGRDEEHADPEQVARLDAHRQAAGEGGDEEGEQGQGEEADARGQRAVAQVVLNVERQVQEHGEDGGRHGEGHDGEPDEGGDLEQAEVEHRVGRAQLVDEERDHQEPRRRRTAPRSSCCPSRGRCPGRGAKTEQEQAAGERDEADPVDAAAAAGRCDSAILASVMKMATIPMGTLTKKIQRHPMALVMAPPTSGSDRHGAADDGAVEAERGAAVPSDEGVGDRGRARWRT